MENAAGLTSEEFKEGLIGAVLGAVGRDDWYMGLDEMLSAIATTNVDTIRTVKDRDMPDGATALLRAFAALCMPILGQAVPSRELIDLMVSRSDASS